MIQTDLASSIDQAQLREFDTWHRPLALRRRRCAGGCRKPCLPL